MLIEIISPIISLIGVIWVAKINANNKELLKIIDLQKAEIKSLRSEVEKLTEMLYTKYIDWRDMQ